MEAVTMLYVLLPGLAGTTCAVAMSLYWVENKLWKMREGDDQMTLIREINFLQLSEVSADLNLNKLISLDYLFIIFFPL